MFRNIYHLFIIVFMISGPGFAQESKIGDIPDGNRAPYVHVIPLLDEEGSVISPDDNIPMPFSLKQTCIECHDYSRISNGWHFNSADPEKPPGRRGEPWILVDPVSATQIPMSYRNWQGTVKPEILGLSPFLFTEKFGRHLTGGGVSENDSTESSDIYLRWMVSGKAEINCLSCHDAGLSHDQSQYDLQMSRQNYRWANAAASELASVYGSAKDMPDNYDIYSGVVHDKQNATPPSVEYDKTRFDSKGKVVFNLTRDIPEKRCSFCHSAITVSENGMNNWKADKDVHLAAGLTCVDCHRNGLDHSITRGYEWENSNSENRASASLTCAGCHIRDYDSPVPQSGRMGAPYPAHKGLPEIHFEKLSCTACHSGPWPNRTAQKVKLSRVHALGTHIAKKENEAVPAVFSPVFVKDEDDKISPHRLIWPSYWAFMQGDSIVPAVTRDIQAISLEVLREDTVTYSANIEELIAGKLPKFSKSQIIRILDSMKNLDPDGGNPVYICGGKLFSLSASGDVSVAEHPAAEPYTWAFAHDVRPKEQSLGIRGCGDCHSMDSPLSLGIVKADVPFDFTDGSALNMVSFQGKGSFYPRVFALTFLFRPVMKYIITICCVIIILVILLYALKGLDAISKNT
ncbi:MAG: hypothetical protein GY863_17270 [bacterium]|nr:hypothetical protein [bacterium]